MTTEQLDVKCGFGTLERPLYSPGQLLEDDDLTSGVNYTRRLTQLLFSSLFGCGVICGLRVSATKDCNGRKLKIEISRGLGLDSLGNPIEVPNSQTLTYDPICKRFPETIWVVACYVDRGCAPRELSCSCEGGNDRAMTRQKDGFELKLYRSAPECACSCEVPKPSRRKETCGRCPGDEPEPASVDATTASGASAAEAHSCYDDHINGVCSCDCGCNCILIGKVKLTLDEDGTVIKEIDDKDRTPVRDIRPFLVGHHNQLQRPADPALAGGPAPTAST